MAAKVEILSIDTIEPSSPTPNHLKDFKLSFLDQLVHPSYIPIFLCYSANDIIASGTNFPMISDKLKTSLSHVLTLYYPFCGRVKKDNMLVECNDEGVIFIESKVPTTNLSDILINRQVDVDEIKKFFPFDPYNHNEPAVNMAVQLNEFSCGGIGVAVCLTHKIADGATVASFLNTWTAVAKGQDKIVQPQLNAALFFPPCNITRGMLGDQIDHKNVVTKRFIFDGTNLSRLREKFGSFNPTRVEAVTALIWKSALEAAKASSKEQTLIPASMASHNVNIRNRMVPQLSEHVVGNLWQLSLSPIVEVNGATGLRDLAEIVRKTVKKIDADYVSKLEGGGLLKVIESLEEARSVVLEKGILCYIFNSWTRFGFYENDFGWGKPTWVGTISAPMKNVIILMATRNGDGIEAWVTLSKVDMVEFEHNPEVLQFTFI